MLMSQLLSSSSILLNRISDLFPNKKPIDKKNVIVIGYGWGGRSFCNNINTDKYNVTIISKNDKMLNTTKLKNFIIDENDNYLCESNIQIENYTGMKSHLNFIKEECIDINKFEKVITTIDNSYKYDYLVVAVGSENNDFNIKGVKENCYFLKSIEDLNKLKNNIDIDKNKNIVILGGGPNGIELAFELSKKFNNIKIIEAMNDILPMFNYKTINIVKEELDKSNIKLQLYNKVQKIDEKFIYTLENNKKKEYVYDLSIWTCGIKHNSLIKKLTSDKFIVNNNLKCYDSIYAIGDIIASKEHGPPTAQNAKQQGEYLAKYFNNDFKGESYKYKEIGKIIHAKDWIIIETSYGTFRLPYFIEPIIDYFIIN
jgi:NADH dehydrogenase FAD-containing subunit